jgi:hypothetical protein
MVANRTPAVRPEECGGGISLLVDNEWLDLDDSIASYGREAADILVRVVDRHAEQLHRPRQRHQHRLGYVKRLQESQK